MLTARRLTTQVLTALAAATLVGSAPAVAHGLPKTARVLQAAIPPGCWLDARANVVCPHDDPGTAGTPGTTTVHHLSEEELQRINDISKYCQHYETQDAVEQAAGLPSQLAGNSKYQSLCTPAARTPGDPGTAAQQVLAGMQLRPPRIGIVPFPGPDSVGLVGLNNWMWVEDPDAQTFGPASDTATLGGWTITVTATVQSVDWDMGDGQVVHCEGPGTPYQDSDGFDPSPDCGHVYTTQGVYTVTATAHWTVDWVSTDQTGTFTTDQTATDQITIGELQVLRKH